ncbi:MAG TPA: copper homeostasis protein CutC, partial [Isosphaeraceae bacterium]|nr:copper homeostasis protein CutC [Isosphaeraceae bacterium]
MSLLVEVCVEGLSSALSASAGGADRIELCMHLSVGGITPSAGLIAQACRLQPAPVHVLIR